MKKTCTFKGTIPKLCSLWRCSIRYTNPWYIRSGTTFGSPSSLILRRSQQHRSISALLPYPNPPTWNPVARNFLYFNHYMFILNWLHCHPHSRYQITSYSIQLGNGGTSRVMQLWMADSKVDSNPYLQKKKNTSTNKTRMESQRFPFFLLIYYIFTVSRSCSAHADDVSGRSLQSSQTTIVNSLPDNANNGLKESSKRAQEGISMNLRI